MLKIVAQRSGADCSIAALATYLCLAYGTVQRAAEKVAPNPTERGMYMTQMIRAAAACGRSLQFKRTCDFDCDEGILGIAGHVVVLWRGLIFDPDGPSVWTPKQYQACHKGKFRSILVPK